MDKEQEIRLQFLAEAQEYLNTIESALLTIATLCTDKQMDAVLRAAHSIKGSAAMMGFGTLSDLAHRFEDFFKVIQAQKNSLEIDTELESLFLAGVDCLKQLLGLHRQQTPVTDVWLSAHVHPVFEQLHQRLGDPPTEDRAFLLMEEDGQDMVVLLFQTEVEGSLQRLESILSSPDKPCLLEEVLILAQELGGLGEMLELAAFTRLCQSITQAVEATPDQVELTAQLAVQTWRHAQTLILSGQANQVPDNLETIQPKKNLDDAPRMQMLGDETSLEETAPPRQSQMEWVSPPDDFLDPSLEAEIIADAVINLVYSAGEAIEDALVIVSVNTHLVPLPAAPELQPEPAATFQPPRKTDLAPTNLLPPIPEAATTYTNGLPEDTVRVAVKQLDQLNDLFGELTIERNGLDLHLGRLRNLVGILIYRTRTLEQTNSRLRSAYDTISMQALLPADADGISSWRAKDAYSNEAAQINPSFAGSSLDASLPYEAKGLNGKFDILEMDRYNDLHLLSQEVMETIVQLQEVTSDIELSLDDADHVKRNLNRTAKQMQINLTQLRMRPLAEVLNRFPRALRELSLQYGKPVELKIYGGSTLVDRSILEALTDPLMHLLRNAFDHGIEDAETRKAFGKSEQGTITLRASYRSNQTIITLSDDGGGINLAKIRTRAQQMGLDAALLDAASDRELLELIFEPGFSTASQVTTLSGRGVGMDVVRTNLKQVQGEIRIDTQLGLGTTFTISVPSTLSIIRVLLVESDGLMLAFPKDTIAEVLLLQSEQLSITPDNEFLQREGTKIPLIHLDRSLVFRCPRRITETEDTPLIGEPLILMINQDNKLAGIQVHRCWGEQEVAIRQVEGTIAMPPGFAGCTILGNGRVVPLVDPSSLLQWMMDTQPLRPPLSLQNASQAVDHKGLVEANGSAAVPPQFQSQPQADTILVVDDSVVVRRALAATLEKAGYRVEQAKDGQDALEKLLNGLQVQAVMCDIEMPRLDGYGFLARVKADPTLKQLPISILTSRSGEKHRQLAKNLGAAAYFSKPYQELELLQTLKHLLQPQVLSSTGS